MDKANSGAGGITPAHGGDQRLLAGRYRLLEKIGEGGAAEVYRARDERLGRIVAIKLLRPQFTMDAQSRSRFAVEARAAARLSHPNIVDVYDFGEAPDGSMFIAMRYIEGDNLKDLLHRRGRLSSGETIAIAVQVCRALEQAHTAGLIHRDVKPQNIMVDRAGNVLLTDFGVVKALSGPALTQSGMTFGTAAYLSPEQATGTSIGPASDLYGLGCVMYELLSGTPPFAGDNPAIVAYKQVWEQPRPLHDVAPEVPPSLETVIMRCLNKDPGQRYRSATALAAELERVNLAFNQPTQAVPLGSAAGYGAVTRQQEGRPLSQAEQSMPVPMPVPMTAPPHAAAQPVPPVRAQAGSQGPTPTAGPSYAQPTAAYQGASTYAGVPPSYVNVNRRRRGVGWLPLAVVVLLVGLGVCGFGAWQGGLLAGFGVGGAQPPSTPTQPVAGGLPQPTAISGKPTPTALATQAPATNTAAPAPTDTSTPPPAPTGTPTPPAPVPQQGNTVTLDDNSFSGGYTRRDGKYHGHTARWAYGQGTPYNTMSAQFTLDAVPPSPVTLTIVGLDSEDPPKTPIQITINGTTIYKGANPLPNDDNSGVNGPGVWGSNSWTFDPQNVLQPGVNTLTITNLDPSDQINYPIFFMLDYATLTW